MPIYPRTLKRTGETVYDLREWVNGKQEQYRGLPLEIAEKKRERILKQKASRRAGIPAEVETVKQLSDKWLDHQKARLRPSTLADYEQCMRLRVVKTFGKRKISAISPLEIQEFINSLAASPRTANKTLAAMRALFRWAESMNLAIYNPAQSVQRIPETKPEIHALTHEQAEKLLAALEGKWRMLVTTALYSGLRGGELAALTWSCVEDSSLIVTRTYRKGEFGEPKTRNSRRRVYIPAFLAAELEAARQAADDLIWLCEDGGMLEAYDMGRAILQPALKKAKIPHIRFHDLRHTYASWMIGAGVDLKFISAQLGHSTIAITLDIYGHLLPNQGAEMMARFADSCTPYVHDIPLEAPNVVPLRKK